MSRSAPRKLTPEEASVARQLSDIMAGAKPTPFAFEGRFVALLRATMCLAGERWARADARARGIVDRALTLCGACRPSWDEGQPEWTSTGAQVALRTTCARSGCARLLPEPARGWSSTRKYCSHSCSVLAYRDRNGEAVRAYQRDYARTRRAALATGDNQDARPR